MTSMTGHAAHCPSLWISRSDDGVATWNATIVWEREDQVGEKERLHLPQLVISSKNQIMPLPSTSVYAMSFTSTAIWLESVLSRSLVFISRRHFQPLAQNKRENGTGH